MSFTNIPWIYLRTHRFDAFALAGSRVESDESEVVVLRVVVGGRDLEAIFGPTI